MRAVLISMFWSKIFANSENTSIERWEGPIRYLINEFWTSGQRKAQLDS